MRSSSGSFIVYFSFMDNGNRRWWCLGRCSVSLIFLSLLHSSLFYYLFVQYCFYRLMSYLFCSYHSSSQSNIRRLQSISLIFNQYNRKFQTKKNNKQTYYTTKYYITKNDYIYPLKYVPSLTSFRLRTVCVYFLHLNVRDCVQRKKYLFYKYSGK